MEKLLAHEAVTQQVISVMIFRALRGFIVVSNLVAMQEKSSLSNDVPITAVHV